MKLNRTKSGGLTYATMDKPTVEPAWTGIPQLVHFPGGDDEMPLLIEKERYGRIYDVEDGGIYTIRLGIHAQSDSVGAFTRDSVLLCQIPTATSRKQYIMAFFAQKEIYPAIFVDDVALNSNIPVRLEYVSGSAALERNFDNKKLILEDVDIAPEEDFINITNIGLDKVLPACYTYTYDFLSFQIKITEDRDYFLEKFVRVLDSGDERWHESITASVGDKLEFRIDFINGDIPAQKIVITEQLPDCLKLITSKAFIHSDTVGNEEISADRIAAGGLEINNCAQDTEIIVSYAVEVVDYPIPDTTKKLEQWSDIRIDSKLLQDYVEIVINP